MLLIIKGELYFYLKKPELALTIQDIDFFDSLFCDDLFSDRVFGIDIFSENLAAELRPPSCNIMWNLNSFWTRV